jgi:hypothetical protein
MRIEQEPIVAELVQKILDLTSLLINIAAAFEEAAAYTLGVARHVLDTG